MSEVISRDGTRIAFERHGAGPALILVDGALCSRAFGPMPKLAALLAKHFTVYMYDRRGRGESGDTHPYAKEREVEDIAALIEAAGGKAFLLGLSSGAALALEATASGLNVARLVAYEPPFMVDDGGHHARANHENRLRELVAAGQRSDAVRYFMRDMVGIPAPFVFMMRLMRGMWRKLEAVAHTLPYDAAVMGDWSVPARRLAAISTPTLAVDGEKSDLRLRRAVEAVARAIPTAKHLTLKGQTHNVNPAALTPAVVEFLAG
jgi:pimeloyl-ACP methyl ester carboxylesterase